MNDIPHLRRTGVGMQTVGLVPVQLKPSDRLATYLDTFQTGVRMLAFRSVEGQGNRENTMVETQLKKGDHRGKLSTEEILEMTAPTIADENDGKRLPRGALKINLGLPF